MRHFLSVRFRTIGLQPPINAVSPTVLTESMDKYADFFRGFLPVKSAEAALGYSKSVEGLQTGQVYCIG